MTFEASSGWSVAGGQPIVVTRFSGWYVSEVTDWPAGRFETLRPTGNARS